MKTYNDKCAFGLNALKNSDLHIKADQIQNSLERIAAFSSISPSPAEVREVINKFKEYCFRCDIGNRQNIHYRNKLRNDLLELLRKQHKGVNYLGAGDVKMLGTSGFPIQRRPEPSGIPPMARITKIEPGPDYGSFYVSIKAFSKRRFNRLIVECAGEQTRIIDQGRVKFFVTDATPGKEVVLTARIHGADAFGPSSNSVKYIVPVGPSVIKPEDNNNDNSNMKVA
jgi:hypothetical protein